MVLSKNSQGTQTQCIYDSSNILSSTYDKSNGNLTLLFKGGVPYIYEGVSLTTYEQFELAESQGKVFNSLIKPHPFTKKDKIDPTVILNEITRLKNPQ